LTGHLKNVKSHFFEFKKNEKNVFSNYGRITRLSAEWTPLRRLDQSEPPLYKRRKVNMTKLRAAGLSSRGWAQKKKDYSGRLWCLQIMPVFVVLISLNIAIAKVS